MLNFEEKAGLSVLAVLLVIASFGFTAFALTKHKVTTSTTEQLFAPLTYASLDKVDAKMFCVTTLADKTADGEMYCTNLYNVHVFVSEKAQNGNGTYADIVSRWATSAVQPARLERFTDFITVYVQTEAERKQYLDEIAYYESKHYAPRAVSLDTPRATPPASN